MSNSVALSVAAPEFKVVRVSKAGKESYRSVLGVISSGNRAERDQLTHSAIVSLWNSATYKPLLSEIRRVFGEKSFDKIVGFLGFDMTKPTKAMTLALMRGLSNAQNLKGEKLLYANALHQCVAAEDARVAALEAQQAKPVEEQKAIEA